MSNQFGEFFFAPATDEHGGYNIYNRAGVIDGEATIENATLNCQRRYIKALEAECEKLRLQEMQATMDGGYWYQLATELMDAAQAGLAVPVGEMTSLEERSCFSVLKSIIDAHGACMMRINQRREAQHGGSVIDAAGIPHEATK